MGANEGEKGSFMFRKSALAMAMLGALTTGQVVALGLGEIELKSALNQPLKAEVELLSATQEELQELKVEVASPQAFANAGIERPLFLSKLRFDVVTNADGRPVVRITSREVVREPFLDFLLELSWSKGRLLREYTVLVDPPLTMPSPAPALQTPSARPAPGSAPVAPAGRVTHTAQLPPVSVAPGQYETRRHDTLWQVAQQVRPDADVSIEQTMLGLLHANPKAFYKNNINNLKAGHILRVPSREELTRISKAEAAREARRQYSEWRQARTQLTPAELTAGAPTAAGAAEARAESSLQLLAPDLSEGDSLADASGLEALQNDLMIANEALEAQRRQGEEMSTRLSVLEEQIQNMRRLIQLKDDELARLQAQVGEEVLDSEPAVAEAAVMEEPLSEPALPDADIAGAAADEVVAAPMEDVVADLEPAAADGLGSEEAAGGQAAPEQAEEQTVVETPPVAEPVVTAAPALPETLSTPGLVDRLLANPLWLGAGAAVLVLLGFFALRRKRSGETEFKESILQAARGKSSPASDSEIIATEPESTQSTTTASSLLSEFAVSDMGSMKSDGEADPLAEADVYLAYGRYQQAEDLIKDALHSNPEHAELNLKLLEVYQAAQNQPAFDEHAQATLGRLENGDDPLWAKIAEMGRELSPNNPLYQQGGAAPGVQEIDEATAFDIALDADEESPEQQPSAATDEVPELDLDEGLDFDMDLGLTAAAEEDDFKPDSAEFSPPEPQLEEAKRDADIGGIEPDSIDLDLDSIDLEPDSIGGAPDSIDLESDSIDLEPDSIGGEPDSIEVGPDSINLGPDNTLEFDLEGLDLGGAEEADLPGDGELADLDEVSTKLDLARAYVDMGDPDGARSILDEVIEEGSVDQKSEAQQILAKIA